MSRQCKINRGVFALILFVLLAVGVGGVLSGYVVRCYSDPANWLRYARDLTEGFRSTKWPIVYPVFLWCAEKMTGQFAIFLVNLPVLAGMVACLAALLGFCCRESGRPAIRGRWVALSFVALAMAFDWPLVYNLVNPYRDPLALLFRAAGVLCFALALERENFRGIPAMVGSGMLMGLSVATREPGVLMVVPLFLYALVVSRGRRFSRTLSYGIAFVLGFSVGILPLIAQTLIKTGGLGPPPQSVADGEMIPGVRLRQLVSTGRQTFDYFIRERWLVAGLAMLSLPIAVAKRRSAFLLLVALPTLMYLFFYSCYYTFVTRYVFYASVGVAAMAAFAIHEMAALVWQGQASTKWRVHAVLTTVIVLVACVRVVGQVPRGPRRRIPEAKVFTQWIQKETTERDVVLCARPVSEFIEILGQREVSRPWRMVDAEGYFDWRLMRDALHRLQDEHNAVFLAERPAERDKQALLQTVRLFYDVTPVASLPAEQFHSEDEMGEGDLVLYRVQPWHSKVSRVTLDSDSLQRGSVVLLFLGDMSVEHAPRERVWMRLGTDVYPVPVSHGVACLRLPHEVDARELKTAVVESDGVMPENVTARLSTPTRGIDMDLGMGLGWLFSECVSEQGMPVWEGDVRVVEMVDNNMLWLPEIGAPGDVVEVALCMNSTILDPSWWPWMTVTCGDRIVWRGAVQETASYRWIRFWLELSDGDEMLRIAIQSREPSRGIERVRVFVDKAKITLLQRPPEGTPLRWSAADPDASTVRLDEIYGHENGPEGVKVAWTTGKTRVLVPVRDAVRYRCRLRYITESLPPDVSADIRLSWNGEPLRILEERREGVVRVLVTEALQGQSFGGFGVLRVNSRQWRPCDYLETRDVRPLGVQLCEISFEPVVPGSAPGGADQLRE